jgi:hypothetical protein
MIKKSVNYPYCGKIIAHNILKEKSERKPIATRCAAVRETAKMVEAYSKRESPVIPLQLLQL